MEKRENNFKRITSLMPCGWEEKARETGAITRSRKIKNAEELLRLNLLYLTSGGSFGKTAAMLKLTEELSLNKNAVYERIAKSGEWLRWLSENICRNSGQLAERPDWLSKKRVCLIDASDEAKPGSNKADYRLHYCVELFTLEMVEMQLTESSKGEKLTNFYNLTKGDLIIADRAYGTIKGLEHLIEKGCEFVIRLRSNAFKVYDANKELVELSVYFESLAENETGEITLNYKTGNEYKPIRICAVRKTAEAEMKGISQIKRSNSKKMRGKVSEKQSIYNKFVIVATNLNAESKNIMELYRMRWQIELVFKRLKSIFSYDKMPSKSKATIEAWFYGKLLIAAICEALVNMGRFSPVEE